MNIPILPIELINKIIILRPAHPVGKLIIDFNEYLKDVQKELKGNSYTFLKCLNFFSHHNKIFIDQSFKEFDFCWKFFKFFQTNKEYLCRI
jgi:hypothetical protein